MRFDAFKAIAMLEGRQPKLSRFLAMRLLGFMSPFNSRLKTEMIEWSDNRIVIGLKKTRGVRNHVRAIHAGAQFTLGETCAGLVIIRNFPFGGYRPLMSEVSVAYLKQARGYVTGECELPAQEIDHVKETIARGDIPTIQMTTEIFGDVNGKREIISVVKTTWQIKPWGLVKSK